MVVMVSLGAVAYSAVWRLALLKDKSMWNETMNCLNPRQFIVSIKFDIGHITVLSASHSY